MAEINLSGNVNKVVLGDTTLIDLTADTVTAGKLISGITAHDKSGNAIIGTFDSDYLVSSDFWTISTTQVEKETITTKTAAVLENKNGGYRATLSTTATITPYTGYTPGTLVRKVDYEKKNIDFTATEAIAIDGMVTDGWVGLYVKNTSDSKGQIGYYTSPDYGSANYVATPTGDIVILGTDGNKFAATPPSGNSTAGYATGYKDSFVTDLSGAYAPFRGRQYTVLELPNLQIPADYNCFSSMGKITSLSFPNLLKTGDYTFYSCSSLTSIDLPVCTSIGGRAFDSCSSLTSIDLPVCTSIGEYAFGSCSSLTSIDLPVCTSIGEYAFGSCSSLTSIDLPVCTSIGSRAFSSCSSLTSIDLPVCTSIGSAAFGSCSSLTSIDLPVCTSIGSDAFDYFGSIKLTTVILRSPTMCKLEGSVSFRNSALKIYVPDALLDEYKAASYWSSWASRFASLEEYEASAANAISLDDDGISTLELEDTQISVDELIAAAENDLKTAQTLGDPTDYIEERLKELYAERNGTSADDGSASVDDDTAARPVAD